MMEHIISRLADIAGLSGMLAAVLLSSCAPRWEVAWQSGGEERFPSEPLGRFLRIGGIQDIDGNGVKEILLYRQTGVYLLKMK